MEIIKDISNESTPKRSLNDVKCLVVHHTGSKASSKNILSFLKRKDYINVHYVVLPEGYVTQTVDENHIAWHAGASEWKWLESKEKSLNWCSIGIEVHSGGYYFTDAQRKATRELINDLIDRYKIPPELILRHKDIAPKRKWDIGDAFWNDEWLTWEEYQHSYQKTMTKEEKKTTDACVSVLSALWSKLSDEGQKIVAETAKQLRKLK